MAPPGPTSFGVLVPVKRLDRAKSRLASLGERARRDLALAFVLDTVSTALAAPRVAVVTVVTDDEVVAAEVASTGASVVPDARIDHLNASLRHAAAESARRCAGLAVAALCADVPAMTSMELGEALDQALAHRSAFVADADRRGTTMLAATEVGAFHPCFGPASRLRHLKAGAQELAVAGPGLRRDVDSPADLVRARELGVAPVTAATLRRLSL